MKLLVVGGAGYIGSHTVRQLRAAGHEVVVLDNLSSGHAEALPGDVTLVRADLLDPEAVKAALNAHQPDAVIHFAPLSPEVMEGVVDKFLRALEAQLAERRVALTVTPAARARLAQLGYDPALGARPLARVIEERLGRPLADELLFGRLTGGGTVKVDTDDEGGFRFSP